MALRKGFTLAELMIAVLIFGFMITSLATIYSTANKHMFQQYRHNAVKSSASVAMKYIANVLMTATRIDAPAVNASGTALAVAHNVDQNSGCYPIAASQAATWHYFCLNGRTLYHHAGALTSGPGCPSQTSCANCFTVASYPAFCGPGGGGTVTQLSNMVTLDSNVQAIFTRKGTAVDKVYEQDQVKIVLRLYWDPASTITGYNLSSTARVIDTTIMSTVKVNRSVN